MFWWLYYIPLLFNVLQRGESCCGCYIVYHYFLMFDREVVHVLVVIYCTPLLFKVLQRRGSCFGGYIVMPASPLFFVDLYFCVV